MIDLDDADDALPGRAAAAADGRSRARRPDGDLVGGRWALALAAALLAAFAGLNLLHRRPAEAAAALETIVQQPVPADNDPLDSRPELSAPDPGDNP